MIRKYFSPSKDASDFLGVKLYDDWGLVDHAGLQGQLLSNGHPFLNGWNEALVDELIDRKEWERVHLNKEDRYHVAFGMISQFARGDILYFLDLLDDNPKRLTKNDREISTIEQKTGYKFQWRVGKKNLELIRKAVNLEVFRNV